MSKRRAETRARLVDAAFEVFVARGFDRTTIEEVCAVAGYTRGAFYSNFERLDELFFALYEHKAAAIAASVEEALAAPARDRMEAAARVVDALPLDRAWALVRIDFLRYAARHPEVLARWQQHQDDLRSLLASRLGPSSAALGAPVPSLGPEWIARAAIVLYHGVMDLVLIGSDSVDGRRLLTELLVAVLDAASG